MESFKTLNESSLVDALAEYTSKFTKLMSDGGGDYEDFISCKQMIESLIAEIDARRRKHSATEPASKEMR